MEPLIINYEKKELLWYLSFILSAVSGIFGVTITIRELIVKNYSILLYGSLLVVVLSVLMILYLVLWNPKPILSITNEGFETNENPKPQLKVKWTDVKEIALGVASLRFNLINGKTYIIDLKEIKYIDIKNIKSTIIEICESKNISYMNDY